MGKSKTRYDQGRIPLYDLLVKVAPVFQDEKGGVYWASQNPDIDERS